MKSLFIRPYARYVAGKVRQSVAKPFEAQDRTLVNIVNVAENTAFGKEHRFSSISSYEEFRSRVPLRSYEQFAPYVDRIIRGEQNVLWPGMPLYFAKTSGTTSGVKFIPITRDSVKNHFNSAQAALLLYMAETHRWQIMSGKMIFLSGSPRLEKMGGINTGRLSGIVNHQIPSYLRGNRLPSWKTNCIEDWEQKLDRIVEETYNKNMTLISGIPPWVQMYFDKLTAKTGKPVKKIFPNLEMLVHGGVNFEPYRTRLEQSLGGRIPTIETYPASEGFIAFQDTPEWQGLLLNVDSGIFFEFVRAENIFDENPERVSIRDVKTGVNYAIVINSNAGLWGYVLGDTVKFLSTNPFRIAVTGRISHFISAFGEHVISEEVEKAMEQTLHGDSAVVTEFTVAPVVNAGNGTLPYHEWLIEFEKPPAYLADFSEKLNGMMCERNIYYKDLIQGKVLQPLKIKALRKNAFIDYMKDKGKLGGQNKVARLSNDRNMAEELLKIS